MEGRQVDWIEEADEYSLVNVEILTQALYGDEDDENTTSNRSGCNVWSRECYDGAWLEFFYR